MYNYHLLLSGALFRTVIFVAWVGTMLTIFMSFTLKMPYATILM